MKEIEIIEVPVASADVCAKFCVAERNERYYIAYETNVHEHNSILFADLAWIRKHFGVDHTEGSPITKESLNVGRKKSIEELKLCILANVPMWELGKVNKDGTIRINPETNEPCQVYRLSKEGKEQFQRMIDKGLLILCKYVD
jgi:hypothetical protein